MASRFAALTVRDLLQNGVISAFHPAGTPFLITFFSSDSYLFQYSLEVIKRLNYVAPTSIQAQAIPAIMSGRDVIGVAKTGSGKTVAFLLPLFRHIKDQRPLEQMEGPMAVVMTPTRELAVQIHKDCKPFLKVLSLRVSTNDSISPNPYLIEFLNRRFALTVDRLSRTK
jgi:superfamily II DNA/RNA helicase